MSANKIENSPENELYQEFVAGPEFKRLTSGEDAVFKEFNAESAQDLQQMRDYIYHQVPSIKQGIEFKNYKSTAISKMQIGQALKVRKDHQAEVSQFEKANPLPRRRAATTSRNGFVGSIKGFDGSRRIRC